MISLTDSAVIAECALNRRVGRVGWRRCGTTITSRAQCSGEWVGWWLVLEWSMGMRSCLECIHVHVFDASLIYSNSSSLKRSFVLPEVPA